MTGKREGVLPWDDYFMMLTLTSRERSKDPNTQVASVIVDEDNVIVSIGYNGFPRWCSDDEFPWDREGDWEKTKYPYVVHAEPNAILNAKRPLKGCKLYNTLAPCNECAKLIIQARLAEIIFFEDKYHDGKEAVAARRMFDAAGVKYRKYEGALLGVERKLTPDGKLLGIEFRFRT